ncbi:MAG: hypothetical protein ACRERE_41265 [Candidatus Entotheonellia bacterium]
MVGEGLDARFAGVFEKNGKTTSTKFDLKAERDWGEPDDVLLSHWNGWAHQNHYKLRWLSVYGGEDEDDRRYAAIWEKVEPIDSYFAYFGESTGTEFQQEFNLRTQQDEVPALITVHTTAPLYSAIWYGSGHTPWGSWIAAHGLTSSNYQQKFDELKAQGFHPVRVQGGGGEGDDIRFAAIFAKSLGSLPIASTRTANYASLRWQPVMQAVRLSTSEWRGGDVLWPDQCLQLVFILCDRGN